MFTLEQINDVHPRLGSAKSFTEYALALKALGVERADSYLGAVPPRSDALKNCPPHLGQWSLG